MADLNSIINYLPVALLYFPLGMIGVIRWVIWLIKKTAAFYYKSIKGKGGNFTFSVITAVYNEKPRIFEKAIYSWRQNSPDEIIAIIDYTDKTNIEIFKEFSKTFKNAVLVVTKTPGKRPALAEGIKISKCDILALTDSDTIWDGDVREAVISPFSDPMVGGVATRQEVLFPKTVAQKLFNIHLSNRYFNEFPFLAATGNALTCLSGRTAVYRRKAIIGVIDEMVNEKFLGEYCISGEDKSLTGLVQKHGWKTKYLMHIAVKTTGEPDLPTFFKQQIRWARNSWRADLKYLFSFWIWRREKILALYIIDRFIQPFVLFFGPMYFILAIFLEHWAAVFTILAFWFFSRAVKTFPHLRRHPADIAILPIYVFFTYLMAFIKIYALFTIKNQGWITRWDKKRFKHSGRLSSAVGYAATVLTIVLIGTAVAGYSRYSRQEFVAGVSESYVFSKNSGKNAPIRTLNKEKKISETDLAIHRNNILANIAGSSQGFYVIKKGDTFWDIAKKYNSDLGEIIEANKSRVQNPNLIAAGQQIIVPVSELSKTPQKIVSNKETVIEYDKAQNIISVKGGLITIPIIYELLKQEEVVVPLAEKQWLLKANISISKGASFIVDENISWLKLKSGKTGFVYIKAENGNIGIYNTKITSWDESAGKPDSDYADGRSFILSKNNGRMDVINSEVAYLGYNSNSKELAGEYGLSWKISGDSLKDNLIAGAILNSKAHDNYYGAYIYGATGIIAEKNEFYNNIKYGISLFGESNNSTVMNNYVYYNGRHGIILSGGSFNNMVSENYVIGNKINGLAVYQESNNNLINENIIYQNADGVAVAGSANNLFENNVIKNNNRGLRIGAGSEGNYFGGNDISENKNSLSSDPESRDNFIVERDITKGDLNI